MARQLGNGAVVSNDGRYVLMGDGKWQAVTTRDKGWIPGFRETMSTVKFTREKEERNRLIAGGAALLHLISELGSLDAAESRIAADAVQQALSAQLAEVKDSLPQDLQVKVQALASVVVDILAVYRASGLAPQDLFVVERTVDDYLPTAVQNYLKLPAADTSIPLPEAEGKTARQLLSDQLDLLIQKMHEVADAAHRKDVEALLVHGRFLEDKFGPSSLALHA